MLFAGGDIALFRSQPADIAPPFTADESPLKQSRTIFRPLDRARIVLISLHYVSRLALAALHPAKIPPLWAI